MMWSVKVKVLKNTHAILQRIEVVKESGLISIIISAIEHRLANLMRIISSIGRSNSTKP